VVVELFRLGQLHAFDLLRFPFVADDGPAASFPFAHWLLKMLSLPDYSYQAGLLDLSVKSSQ
jgi:hypothetical protein